MTPPNRELAVAPYERERAPEAPAPRLLPLPDTPEHGSAESAPGTSLETDSLGAFLDLIRSSVRAHQERTALGTISPRGSTILSYRELWEQSRSLAAWLDSCELAPEEPVALLAEGRPEWCVTLLGGMMGGATVVPLDPKLELGELEAMLRHSGASILFASSAQAERALALRGRLARVRDVVLIDQDAVATGGAHPLASLPDRGSGRPRARGAHERALIVYTSGTTSDPKGVEITFGNLEFQTRAMSATVPLPWQKERMVSLLPLNHLYELVCGLCMPLVRGAAVYYCESLLPAEVTATMRRHRCVLLLGVPLLFRALRRGIDARVAAAGAPARAYLSLAHRAAPWLPPPLKRLLFRPILRAFGPLRMAFSGGAALDPAVAEFFAAMGVALYQGYGLTETSPVIATNGPKANRIGSVGRPLPGAEVRIDARAGQREGEILTRGPHVMRGYLRRVDLTRELIDPEGWLHTGDLGYLDADGYLYVTGRAKDLIVLGGGKKVHPDEVEEPLSESPLFDDVCVLGTPSARRMDQGFDEVCAVVVPAPGLGGRDLQERIEAEVAQCSARIAGFKRPTRVIVRQSPLPQTPTRKHKRPLIRQWVIERASSTTEEVLST